MFRIKICGVTNVQDAAAAVDAGADAIGLNFYQKSSRHIGIDAARKIADALGDSVARVGVFVNQIESEIDLARDAVGLWYVQLHGDESPESIQSLAQRYDIIWARRYPRTELDVVGQILRDILQYTSVVGWQPQGTLIDAAAPGQYGGSGETVSWDALRDYRARLGDVGTLILAGGLTPDNVAEAIHIVRPAAVDVASGVESSPGKKDHIKVRDFIQAAQAAFEAIKQP
jgi:phosphoribosylanthranilate isomerase